MINIHTDVANLLFNYLDAKDGFALGSTNKFFYKIYMNNNKMKKKRKIQEEKMYKRKIKKYYKLGKVDNFPSDFVDAVHCTAKHDYSSIRSTNFNIKGGDKDPFDIFGIEKECWPSISIPKFGNIYESSTYQAILFRGYSCWGLATNYNVENECGSCDGTTSSFVEMYTGTLKEIWDNMYK